MPRQNTNTIGDNVGAQSLKTINGDIKLRDSVVEGDIIFRETQQYGNIPS
ncbi:MAG: hypothetical protein ACJAX5_002563 [Patiriisocius sp.]|jgi:hypothetical protein